MDVLGKLPFCNDKFIRDVKGGKQLSLTNLQYSSREGDGGAQINDAFVPALHTSCDLTQVMNSFKMRWPLQID